MYMDREHILLLKGKTTKWFPTTITLMSSLTKISLGFIFLFLLGRANGMDLCCHSGGAVCCSAFWHRQSWLFICTHYSDVVPVHWWHWNLQLNQIRHRCSESFLSKIHRRLLQNEWKGCMDLPWGHPFMLYRWLSMYVSISQNQFPNTLTLNGTKTGTEAMFADLGHFNIRSIQVCVCSFWN